MAIYSAPTFSIPYEPYPSQQEFMEKLYDCLKNSYSGIFESPTGTGKTLSIICSAFKWANETPINIGPQPHPETPSPWGRFEDDIEDIEPLDACTGIRKVIYCTRTHSQINQFIQEVKTVDSVPQTGVAVMASRSKLCIHDDAKNSDEVAEFCRGLKQPCPYKENRHLLTGSILTAPLDIEDLETKGRDCSACPYYAMRDAVKSAKVLVAPYQYVLMSPIRNRLKLIDKATVIIIDEAHNVNECILSCNSFERTISGILESSQVIVEIINELSKGRWRSFKNQPENVPRARLERESETIVENLKHADKAITLFVKNVQELVSENSMEHDPLEFLQRCGLDVDELKNICTQLEKYSWQFWRTHVKVMRKNVTDVLNVKEVGKMLRTVSFISYLGYEPGGYKILLKEKTNEKADKKTNEQTNEKTKEITIKHFLLDPELEFAKLLESARCVIFAGGTMSPKFEFKRLFESLPSEMVRIHSFDAIVPKENMLLAVIKKNNEEKPIRLNYKTREDSKVHQHIFNCLHRLALIVPNGIVCFFPSKLYLQEFFTYVNKNRCIQDLMQIKELIYDDHDYAMEQYTQAAKTTKGAMLFTFARGTNSEGINFGDEIGRCAVIIGQPFPNTEDRETQLRLEFMQRGSDKEAKKAALFDICFRVVNQCLGRVIRKKNDFAVGVLLDERYSETTRISSWMRRNMVASTTEKAYHSIEEFFENR